MKKKLFYFVGALVFLFSSHISAQTKTFNKLSVGLGASTLGPKVEVATSFGKFVTLRGGLSMLPYKFENNFSVDASAYGDYKAYIDYDPELKLDSKISFFHTHLLADIAVVPNGIFHFTVGLFIGSGQLQNTGILLNPTNGTPVVEDLRKNGYTDNELPMIDLEDNGEYLIRPDNDGRLSADLKLGNAIKPYVGLGIGRTIPNKKIGIKFDFGLLYQGGLKLVSENVIKGDVNEYIKTQDFYKNYSTLMQWYPMLNLQISYRIF